jgi:hypothetical protein
MSPSSSDNNQARLQLLQLIDLIRSDTLAFGDENDAQFLQRRKWYNVVKPLSAALAQMELSQSCLQRGHGSKNWKPVVFGCSPQIESSKVLQLVEHTKVFRDNSSASKEVETLEIWKPRQGG